MSHAINEAGAAALPVVAFDDGAAAQQLEGGAAGILVPPGDTGRLVAALDALIASPDLRARLGGALRTRVLDEFSAQRVIPRWQMLFDEVAVDLPRTRMRSTVRRVPDHALAPFPAEIQIETNTACNATCVMCPYPEVSKEMKPGRMDAPLYEKILGECADRAGGVAAGAVPQQRAVHRRAHGRLDRDGQDARPSCDRHA